MDRNGRVLYDSDLSGWLCGLMKGYHASNRYACEANDGIENGFKEMKPCGPFSLVNSRQFTLVLIICA